MCVYIYIFIITILLHMHFLHNISESNKKCTLIYIHIYDILNSIYIYTTSRIFSLFVYPRFLFLHASYV